MSLSHTGTHMDIQTQAKPFVIFCVYFVVILRISRTHNKKELSPVKNMSSIWALNFQVLFCRCAVCCSCVLSLAFCFFYYVLDKFGWLSKESHKVHAYFHCVFLCAPCIRKACLRISGRCVYCDVSIQMFFCAR